MPSRWLAPERRTMLMYFTYFMGPGAAVVFLPIWLDEKGLSADQIGLVNALPVFVILVLNSFVGRLADRAGDWRQVIVIGALIAGIVPVGLFFVHDFWGILIVWTLLSLPMGAVGPVLDAATMRLSRRIGTEYSAIRAWGTVGYMLVNALTGFLVAGLGAAVFVPLFLALSLLRAGAAMALPRFRAPERAPVLSAVAPGVAGKLGDVMKPWFVLPLAGYCMVYGTHFILNGFGALLWKAQGIPESVIGPLVALGALSEAVVMFVFKRVGKKLKARHLIVISALASVLRWTVMAFQPPLPVLILLQATHGITWALGFLGCVHFIANWTDEAIAAETQSLFAVGQQIMSVVSLIVFGWLVAALDEKAYLIAAGFALTGGALVWLSLRMRQPKG